MDYRHHGRSNQTESGPQCSTQAFIIHSEGAELNALPRVYHPCRGANYILHGQLNQTESGPQRSIQAFIIHPGEADLNALPRPLQSIPKEQISMLYHPFIIHPGGADLDAPSMALSSIPGEQISMLYLRLYYPCRGSRSHIA